MTAGPDQSARALEQVWQSGRAAWPNLALDAARFAEWLAARLGPEDDPASLVAADLYLVACCLLDVPDAARQFIEGPLARTRPNVVKLLGPGEATNELMQELAVHLLMPGPDGREPKVAQYTGRGALAVWLRMTATRQAINRGKVRARTVDVDQLGRDLTAEHDVELSALRMRHKDVMADVFRDAIRETPAEHRVLLRMHYAQGSTLNELAVLFRTSRSGIHRKVEEARDALLARVDALTRARLKLRDHELQSMIAVFRSGLREQLRGLLASDRS